MKGVSESLGEGPGGVGCRDRGKKESTLTGSVLFVDQPESRRGGVEGGVNFGGL